MKGVIKTFVPEKKFGFIKGDDGKDYFFHQASFKEQQHRKNISDNASVEFDPVPTPKGYRAECCSLVDSSNVTTYVVPDRFLTSRGGNIKGWEIIEIGNWIIHGASRESPGAAKRDLIGSAMRVRANALIYTEYYKTTGSEPGTGSGIHNYTIHNFRARIVTVAKKDSRGDLRVDDLLGLNQRAEAEKRRLVEMTAKSKRKRNAALAIIVGSSFYLFGFGLAAFAVMFAALIPSMLVGWAIDDDDLWLQRSQHV